MKETTWGEYVVAFFCAMFWVAILGGLGYSLGVRRSDVRHEQRNEKMNELLNAERRVIATLRAQVDAEHAWCMEERKVAETTQKELEEARKATKPQSKRRPPSIELGDGVVRVIKTLDAAEKLVAEIEMTASKLGWLK